MAATSRENDPFGLARFLEAQKTDYETALAELSSGCKQSHWMWYIFPQLQGLGSSSTARYYAITGAAEARAYLEHPVLGPRLIACAGAALRWPDRSAHDIFGSPDDVKFRSCATLFAAVSPTRPSVFDRVIDQFFNGEPDGRTIELLGLP